jgi:uncharacterized repeat protein (TIGR03803 family)
VLSLVPGAILSLLLTTSQAQTNYQQILSFGLLPQSGSSPRAQLMEGSDGWLYGTTYAGGASNVGTIFKISKNGSGFSRIYTFTNSDLPYGGLVEASDGALCGATSGGGANHSGTVFKCSKDGSGFTLLHVFPSGQKDGTYPVCSLIKGNNGLLYGTTFSGGEANKGTVFGLNPDGSGYTNLHNFTGTTGFDGSFPWAGLYQGLDGALYGTTQTGGSNDFGIVFRINPNDSAYEILHHFSGGTNDTPRVYGSLVQGSDGLLYGTTYSGGTNNLGTVFKLNTNGGSYAVLLSFTSGSDGNQPFAGLVAGSNSVLYGTTRYGGGTNGTVFRVNTDGTGYAVLHRFSDNAGDGDGRQPLAPLLMGSDGALYGSTYYGGRYATNGALGDGTLFRMFASCPQIVITMLGDNPLTNECHFPFVDPGATASDGGCGLASFTTNSTVNPNAVGSYTIQYVATDSVANTSTNTRTVIVQDTTPPVITNCAPAQTLIAGPSGTATLSNLTALVSAGDACSASVTIVQAPPPGAELPVGTNTVSFYVDDGNGNTNTCSTTVTVNAAGLVPPVVLSQTIIGGKFQLSFSGPDGQSYRVLATTDLSLPLASWTVLTNGTFAGPATFIDTATADNPARFYKVGSP